MGLDMSLYRKTQNLPEGFEYKYEDEDDRKYEEFDATHEQVAYWRKVNHVHGWFVNTLADGVDECQQIAVTREQITELRDTAQKVLDAIEYEGAGWGINVNAYDEDTVNDLLPPVGGFFFGSYDIDSWYVTGTQETVKMLTEVLEQYPDAQEFVYWASW